MSKEVMNSVVTQIKSLLESARQKVAAEVNTTLLTTYWQIGKIIVEDEQRHSDRAEYGKQTLKTISKALTEEYGKGFSRSSLQIYGCYTLHTRNARHCLANCRGHIIVSFLSFPMSRSAAFTKKNARMRAGLSAN